MGVVSSSEGELVARKGNDERQLELLLVVRGWPVFVLGLGRPLMRGRELAGEKISYHASSIIVMMNHNFSS